MQERAAARYPFVRIVDTDRFFCDHGVCGPMRGNVVLYWDAHHVTSTAARDFAAWTLARQPELSPSAPGTR